MVGGAGAAAFVDLKPNGALAMSPVPELEMLRGESRSFTNVCAWQAPMNTGVHSTSFECLVEIDRRTAGTGELIVSIFASACGLEYTDVCLDLATNKIVIDRSNSSLFPNVHKSPIKGDLPPVDGAESLKLRIFADQSIVEVFFDDETCLSARVYPSLEGSDGIELRSSGDTIVCKLKVWEEGGGNPYRKAIVDRYFDMRKASIEGGRKI
jgi:beta-fructofuranosidase